MNQYALDKSQKEAVDFAIASGFAIINGGAGCGKTTIIKSIVDELDKRGEEYELCAFAGKAAARLKQATEREAKTIHRMLQWMGERFQRGTLKNYTVIIDEASMVSSSLMAQICRREPKRLVLVGDEAQLPPVGKGQPFHDLIKMFPGIVRTLTTCYRNREAVYQAALAIRNGHMPAKQLKTKEEIWSCRPCASARGVHSLILDMVRNGELDFRQDIILVPRNQDETSGASSVETLNADIVDIVNPREGKERFRAGDRVINTVNTPDLDVWNGTTATVVSIGEDGRMYLELDFPAIDMATGELTNNVTIPKDKVKNFRLAYALTVHKSQGSQYRKVILIVLQRDLHALLDRAMVYTGITRACYECQIIGEMQAFANAINKQSSKQTIMQTIHSIIGE